MFYIISIQHVFDLEKNIFNTLFLSAIIILAIHPFELYSLGFQLSFGATFGIITFFNLYAKAFSALPSRIANTIAAGLSAQVFIFPTIFIQMKEINLAGLLSNLVIVFSMSITLIVSLTANFISLIFLPLAKFLGIATDRLYSISLYLIQYLSDINGHFSIEGKAIFLLLPYILFLFPVMSFSINKKIKCLSVAASVICCWIILSNICSSAKNKIAILHNKTNSIIILKENKNALIFGSFVNADDLETIARFLNTNNVKNTDICIPTPSYTNLKNYTRLIKRIIVSGCYISPDFIFNGYFKKFCNTLDADNIRLKITDFKNYKVNKTPDYNPDMIKQLITAPSDNIGRLYNLLISDYDLKDVVIDDIISQDYKIEYLE